MLQVNLPVVSRLNAVMISKQVYLIMSRVYFAFTSIKRKESHALPQNEVKLSISYFRALQLHRGVDGEGDNNSFH